LISDNEMAAHLSTHGVRPTRHWLAIANALFKDEGRHLDATCLYVELGASATKVSLATVYNVLKAFDKAGLVRRVALGGERVLYDTDTSNHHHFFVVSEDRVIDKKRRTRMELRRQFRTVIVFRASRQSSTSFKTTRASPPLRRAVSSNKGRTADQASDDTDG
jgi:Fe2+ or Zn2+ uptake regulation protein